MTRYLGNWMEDLQEVACNIIIVLMFHPPLKSNNNNNNNKFSIFVRMFLFLIYRRICFVRLFHFLPPMKHPKNSMDRQYGELNHGRSKPMNLPPRYFRRGSPNLLLFYKYDRILIYGIHFMMIAFYHQVKRLIGFQCRQNSNFIFLLG